MERRTAGLVLSVWLIAACGGDDPSLPAQPGQSVDEDAGSHQHAPETDAAQVAQPDASPELDAGHDAAPAPAPEADASLPPSEFEDGTLQIGPIPTAPGDEQTVCVVAELDNAETLFVRELEARIEAGSHHMIISRTTQEPLAVPTPCGPQIQDENMLFIAQRHESTLRYPDPAALILAPHQRVRIELHYFNGSGGPLDVTASVTFKAHQGETAGLLPVKTDFTGDLSLEVTPGSSMKESFFPMSAGRNYFALTTHTHRLGVLATLHRAASMSDPEPEPLHRSEDWAEPPLTTFDPPLTFAGDGVLLACHYENDTGATVSFGTSALAEMCFFWGYYY